MNETTLNAAVETIEAPAEVDTRALAFKPWWVTSLKTRAAAILGLDVVLFIFFTIFSPGHVFFSVANSNNLLLSGTEVMLLSVGLALLLGAGIFDLSLGANLVLSSVVSAKVIVAIAGTSGSPNHILLASLAGIVAAVFTGMIFGLLNGILVAIVGINALIATLGTLGIGTGVAYVISGGSDITGLPAQLQENFGLKEFGPIPAPAIVAIVVAILAFVLMRFTRFGVQTVGIGSSRVAASRAGIRVSRHLIALTVIAGALAGLAGFVDITHFAGTTIEGHSNDALSAVTAVVIGGTLLEGGRVSIPGAVWGTGLAVILQGGLVIIGVSSYYQLMAVGLALIVAVGIDRGSVTKWDKL